MTNSLDMEALAEKEDLDIDALDDSQLYEMLKENNIVAGPIVDSTRNVYKKRLRTVLYGNDEAEGEAMISDEESEEGNGANDRESEEEVEDSDEGKQKDEEASDRDTNHEEPPMEMKDEDNEDVLDEEEEEPYESKSDTEDDQPSGISRPVPSSGLRKRFPETVPDPTQTDGEDITGKSSGTEGKMETSSGWITKAVLSMMGVGIVATCGYFISSLDFEVPETVDSMQEAIQEAANKAADEV